MSRCEEGSSTAASLREGDLFPTGSGSFRIDLDTELFQEEEGVGPVLGSATRKILAEVLYSLFLPALQIADRAEEIIGLGILGVRLKSLLNAASAPGRSFFRASA